MAPSTRARSASAEARVSKKPKSSARAKQSTLPTVQESSEKQRSGLVSTTTAQNSITIPKGGQEKAETLIAGLQELWTISDQLLNRILPELSTEKAVDEVVTRLLTSGRFQRDIQQQHGKLREIMSKYPGTSTINISLTNLEIFGTQNAEKIGSEVLRPDNVLYRANLAYALGVLVGYILDGPQDFDSEEMLRLCFETFSRVIRSNEKPTRGSTSCSKATFDLALLLQTSHFWEELDDAREDEIPNLDELELLTETFFYQSALPGWNVDGLRLAELKDDQRKAVTNRTDSIKEKLGSAMEEAKLREELCSLPTLVFQCFSWIYQRNQELLRLMSKVPHGVLGIQESIDHEIGRLGNSGSGDTIRLSTTLPQPSFVRPEALSRVKASTRGMTRSAATPDSVGRQQSSGELSAVTAPAYQSEHDLNSANDNNDSFEPLVDMGNEGFEDLLDSASVVRESEHYEPTEEQKQRLSQVVARKTEQANKENLPHRGSKPGQRLDQDRVSPNGSPDQAVNYANKGKNKRARPTEEEEDDDEDDEDDESVLSQDGANNNEETEFQTQRTPEKVHRQRSKPLPPVPPTSSRVAIRSSTSASQPKPRATSQTVPSSTQRADLHHEVNTEAKQRVADFKIRNEPKARVAWSDEETECLLEYIDQLGTQWAKMKDHDASFDGRNILWQRDNVALKDKARNIKLDFMKANRPLPPGLEAVTLRKADEAKLRAMGLWDDVGGVEDQ